MIVLKVVGWIICGSLAAMMMFAYVQATFSTIAEEDYREDLGMCWGIGLMAGPLALIVAFFFTGFAKHGLRLK